VSGPRSPGVRVHQLTNGGDARGDSFPVAADLLGHLRSVEELHVTTLKPGHVRGNHFHIRRREVLVVSYTDSWSLHWDTGAGEPVQSQPFDGAGCALVTVDPLAAHAIRNDGTSTLHVFGLTDGRYDPSDPDAYRRAVVAV
jgi:dTDP-4-dehydrorhamnose 3,5-epimerase-like enzyme